MEASMNKTNLIGFSHEDVPSLLDDLGFDTRKEGNKKLVLAKNSKVATCEICEKELTTHNLGNIASGSDHLFCDNPVCLTSYIEAKKTTF